MTLSPHRRQPTPTQRSFTGATIPCMGVWERRILIGLALIAAVAVAYAGFRFAYYMTVDPVNR